MQQTGAGSGVERCFIAALPSRNFDINQSRKSAVDFFDRLREVSKPRLGLDFKL